MLLSLAQTSMENRYYCPFPRLWASEQAGSLVAAAEGKKGSAVVLRSGTEAWAQQRSQVPGPAATAVCWAVCRRQMVQGQPDFQCSLSQACSLQLAFPSPLTTGLLSLPPSLSLSILPPSASLLSRSIHFFCLTLSLSYIFSFCLSASLYLCLVQGFWSLKHHKY